jgi:hypothetical protein
MIEGQKPRESLSFSARRGGVAWGRESLRPFGEANRPAGFVKFTFLAPGRVASWAKILGSSKRLSRPDLPLQLINLTTPRGAVGSLAAEDLDYWSGE